MDPNLSAAEVRVLGALIEKAVTTPDYYPLTLNALVAACNQTSNRSPVVHYDQDTVAAAIDSLRHRNLAHQIRRSDSRVVKYHHVADRELELDAADLAVLCVLMLRGPQTAGEIRTRSTRLFAFPDLAATEASLDGLASRPSPLVARLPRGPGQKEARYAQLLTGEAPADSPETTTATPQEEGDRLVALEATVDSLRGEVAELRARLDELRRQFE